MQDQRTGPNPSGLCWCGCGERTPVAPETDRRRGRVKGQPMRFVRGHNARRTAHAYEVDPGTGCWEWLRFRDPKWGYGKLRRGEQVGYAHRLYWEDRHGPVPDGYDLHHTCENAGCCNPDHLELLTKHEHKRRHTHLTEADIAAIRETPKVRGSGVALAAKYGVTSTVICGIRSGRTYKPVGGPA